ncbi:isoleucine--tRNA ligase [bacterium]|nr:isoleucine--tRNA ligase [bacterium]
MFKQVDKNFDFAKKEKEVLDFWKNDNTFQKTIDTKKEKPTFTFYEGPPTANGKPGIHHLVARAVKDLVCRYKTMQGFQVFRKAGWDTHGLPVELEVERLLKLDGKTEVVRFGLEKFNEECRNSVFKYLDHWQKFTDQMGYWVDLNNAYITLDNNYIESVWWVLNSFYEKGMIYKGFKIMPYCPHDETPLSSHEVSQGYKDVKDPSVYVKIKLKNEENTYFLVWTTTPWTLISNVGLAVGKNIDYVKVKTNDYFLILAKERLSVLKDAYEIIEEFKGSQFLGQEYERIFDYFEADKKGWFVVSADFVTTTDGSGIVHLAPAYGEEDYKTCKNNDLPFLHPVNAQGKFPVEVTDFAGMFVKDADEKIIMNLKKRQILYRSEKFEHSYPHCWRCRTPLLYYAREAWFIEMTKIKEQMLEANRETNWFPKEVGTGRFGSWLDNLVDWSLSRDRFWATPLNIWICEACEHRKSIGSIAELRKHGKNVPEKLDLHRPYIDEVKLTCEKCNGEMARVPEVIDCWFDSGSMPYAQLHYPFENKELFEKSFPADFICEGIDQTRGWFYSLMAISTFLFGKSAYKNVVVNELVLDKEGQKMSKSRGNVVDPFKLMDEYGADILRWYLVTVNPIWIPIKFDLGGVEEVKRKFFGTLFNTYSFFVLYANIDNFDPKTQNIPLEKRPETDRWILSRLNTVVSEATKHLDGYDLTRAYKEVSYFVVEEVSNWYVRLNRRRFWKTENNDDKLAAYQTLHEVLVKISQLIAPVAPFFAEEIFQNLTQNQNSVHLSNFPKPEKEKINFVLEEKMELTRRIVELGRSLRTTNSLKVRQPLSKIFIESEGKDVYQDLIKTELNVKEIGFIDKDSELVQKSSKANFRLLGKRFGNKMKDVANLISNLSRKQIIEFENSGSLKIEFKGEEIEFSGEEIEVVNTQTEGMVAESDGKIMVVLDTKLTTELVEEGFARELVNKIQNLRKSSGFEVTDKIKIKIVCDEIYKKAFEKFFNYVLNEVLATELKFGNSTFVNSEEFELQGKTIKIFIGKN